MSVVLFSSKDLVPVDFLDVQTNEVAFTLLFSPISQSKKIALSRKLQNLKQDDFEAVMDATKDLIKACLKGIEGVETPDGEAFELEMEKGVITDDCFDNILELPMIDKVFTVAGLFLRSVPTPEMDLVDMQGNIVSGVKVKKRQAKK
jgi:hypothetical protein